jgi:hypothetical protein
LPPATRYWKNICHMLNCNLRKDVDSIKWQGIWWGCFRGSLEHGLGGGILVSMLTGLVPMCLFCRSLESVLIGVCYILRMYKVGNAKHFFALPFVDSPSLIGCRCFDAFPISHDLMTVLGAFIHL